jgi:hypothetical protein
VFVRLQQHRTHQAGDRRVVGEDADHPGVPLGPKTQTALGSSTGEFALICAFGPFWGAADVSWKRS